MKNKLFFVTIIALAVFIYSGWGYGQDSNPLIQNKISLDIKGMDIVDVLKMLATRAGINIAIGKNVTGRVTLLLKDVNVWDAFEIVVLANDLAYEKKGEIINVMSQRDYELQYGERYLDKKEARVIQLQYAKAADLSRALNQIKSNIGKIVVDEGSNTIALIDGPEKIKEMEKFIKSTDFPLETKVFNLNYAQADKLQPKIQETLTKGVGNIKVDERTNKIAVTDYPSKLDEIAKIINAFDEKTPQVLIDAQIIEIKPSDKFEMGIDWDYWIEKNFDMKAALPIGTTNRLILGTPSTTPAGKGEYKAILDLLRTIGDTKILSSPRIMTINNQEAKILVGTRDAYITSTTSQSGDSTVTSQSVNFVDVGIKLYVTPTINRDGFVTMKIKPEISSAVRTDITSEGSTTQIPIVTTSEAETSVIVKDGITIIIGGLRKDEKTKTVKKIPLLGDIPGLGLFFKSTSDEVKKTELVILLTPHIVSGEIPYTEVTALKPKDGVVIKMERGEIVTERIIGKTSDELIKSTLDKFSQLTDKDENAAKNNPDYYKLVVDKIRGLTLFGLPKGEKGDVKLVFTLSKDGSLQDGPYVYQADNSKLTPLTLWTLIKTIKSASPFPSFPESLKKDVETFNIDLSYE